MFRDEGPFEIWLAGSLALYMAWAIGALEDELGVATVYLHQIVLWTANLADHAEKVGNRLRLLIAH